MTKYCKRLIEVDLPIRRISNAAIKEKKSAGHGHLTTIHIWWARRPLAACRSVICASLWPDPVDALCPDRFRKEAARILKDLRDKRGGQPRNWDDGTELRLALLDFLAEFSEPQNSTNKECITASIALTEAALSPMDSRKGSKSLLVDPFAGGGAIPIEALRVGADAYASDLNPVAVLLNKVVLEYIPEFGHELALEVTKWGDYVWDSTWREVENIYPKDPEGNTPIAYICARTIRCEGPGCGARLPLIRSLWLAKKSATKVALKVVPCHKSKTIDFELLFNPDQKNVGGGTVKRGSVTCPLCSYTTSVDSVRKQLISKEGGIYDAQLIAVVSVKDGIKGRIFRKPAETDFAGIKLANKLLEEKQRRYLKNSKTLPLQQELPLMSGVFNAPIYGMNKWSSLYTNRQMLVLLTLVEKINSLRENAQFLQLNSNLQCAILTCLALVQSKLADLANSLCNWEPNVPCVQHLFGRQAIQMSWDFAEGNILGSARGSWQLCQKSMAKAICANSGLWKKGQAEMCDATKHMLPNNSVDIIVTDPPYYNAVPFADLSDFFYLWLKQSLGDTHKHLFFSELAPKKEEICEMASWDAQRYAHKDRNFFETRLKKALEEMRRIQKSDGLMVVAFAHKSTASWEALLTALVAAGWQITASWPIDTELPTRLRAMKSATLSSSIWLVARPRVNLDGQLIMDYVGDWRDILQELPKRIHEWMPRLAEEGVVGADAIFACLGPALEIFSRYSKVEKASGEEVTLREYLEHVWAAVAKEALNMIFEGADAAGFEEDSRLTAMWLWTLSVGANGNGEKESNDEKTTKSAGYTLEFDAARKIAQGLGAHLENLGQMVEIKGDKARLLSVAERTKYLFGKDESQAPVGRRKKKDSQMQLDFMAEVQKAEREEGGWGEKNAPRAGDTVLDQLHQAMILFAAGRGEAMKRFLVEEGIGRDGRFWRLAQAFSALYPSGTDEKRWVDGVLARKKGLGF